MLETITTLTSLLISGGAATVIGTGLWEERRALRRALTGAGALIPASLPPHTHRVAGERRARFVTLAVTSPELCAAA